MTLPSLASCDIDDLPTQHLFGLDFVATSDLSEVADLLMERASRPPTPEWQCVVTPNVDHLVRYRRNADEEAVARHATVVLPDGMPIVWASRLLDRRLPARLAGSDLFALLWPRLVADRTPVVVVASSDVVAEGLGREHPGAVTLVPPLFDPDDDDAVKRVIDEIDRACEDVTPRFLVVGVSMQKTHLIAARLRDRWAHTALAKPTVMLLGASADMYVGAMDRAPEWMRDTGLEWLHRLVGEPRRMAKRYLVDDVAFVSMVWYEWRRHRRNR